MADDPKQKIERLLENAAQQRRAIFPEKLPIPESTKARLLREVSRHYTRANTRSDESLLAGLFWRRLGWVFCCCAALVVVGTILLMPRRRPMEMAQVNSDSAVAVTTPTMQSQAERPPATPMAPPPAMRMEVAPPKAEVKLKSLSPQAARPASPVEQTETVHGSGEAAGASAPLPNAAPAPARDTSTQASVTNYAVPRLRFQRASQSLAARENFNSPRRSQALSEFVLEMAADGVRLIDADGSIYTGKWQEASSAKPPLASAPSQLQPGTGERKAFSAEGIDRRTQMKVVIRGTLSLAQEQASFGRASAKAETRGESATESARRVPPGALIQGNLVLSNGETFPFEARQVREIQRRATGGQAP